MNQFYEKLLKTLNAPGRENFMGKGGFKEDLRTIEYHPPNLILRRDAEVFRFQEHALRSLRGPAVLPVYFSQDDKKQQ
jgi:hypothetical protein